MRSAVLYIDAGMRCRRELRGSRADIGDRRHRPSSVTEDIGQQLGSKTFAEGAGRGHQPKGLTKA